MRSFRCPSTVLANIVLSGTIAVSWILAAHFNRYEGDTDPAQVRWALSGLGLCFTACGLWTYARAQTPLTRLFLWYCTLSGVHWGGPIGAGSSSLQSIELAVFVILGTVAPQAIFLDLARCAGPSAGQSSIRRRRLPYLPVLAGGGLILMVLTQPANERWPAMLPAFYVTGIVLSLIGGLIWVVRPFTAREDRFGYAVVAVSIFLGWLPHALVAGGLVRAEGYEGLFNLPLVLVPLGLSWYLGVHSSPGREY